MQSTMSDSEEFPLPVPKEQRKPLPPPLRYIMQRCVAAENKKARKLHLPVKVCAMLDSISESQGVTKSEVVAFALIMFFKRYNAWKSSSQYNAATFFLEAMTQYDDQEDD